MKKKDANVISKKRENTAQKIIRAVKETKGLLTAAASRAGVSYVTIFRYSKDFPSVAQAITEAREGMKDYAESKLYEAIKEDNLTAIIFYLKTQAKDRGYIERAEFTGKEGEGIQLIFKPAKYEPEEGTDEKGS